MGVTLPHLEELESIKLRGPSSQVRVKFVDDLLSLMKVKRTVPFREHLLLIKVFGHFVEYQEIFKISVIAEES